MANVCRHDGGENGIDLLKKRHRPDAAKKLVGVPLRLAFGDVDSHTIPRRTRLLS